MASSSDGTYRGGAAGLVSFTAGVGISTRVDFIVCLVNTPSVSPREACCGHIQKVVVLRSLRTCSVLLSLPACHTPSSHELIRSCM